MTNTIDRYTFEDALANYGVLSEDIRGDYSGRGMFGRVCIGVVADGHSASRVGTALARFAEGLREEAEEIGSDEDSFGYGDEDVDRLEEMAQKFDQLAESVSTDNMGLDMIVYFPGWEFDA